MVDDPGRPAFGECKWRMRGSEGERVREISMREKGKVNCGWDVIYKRRMKKERDSQESVVWECSGGSRMNKVNYTHL